MPEIDSVSMVAAVEAAQEAVGKTWAGVYLVGMVRVGDSTVVAHASLKHDGDVLSTELATELVKRATNGWLAKMAERETNGNDRRTEPNRRPKDG